MPASLLYHTNQITNVQVKDVEYFSDKVVFNILFVPENTICPCCSHTKASCKGQKIRKLRMAPMGNKKAWIAVELHRLRCCNCHYIWWPSMLFARPKKRVTISFEKYVIELMRFATIEHVAGFLGVSWDLVKGIHKAHLKETYTLPDLGSVRYIGVDEFSLHKGHEYMTVFIDLERGVIIHAVEGKSVNAASSIHATAKGASHAA